MAYLEMVLIIGAVWCVAGLAFGLLFGRIMARGLGPWE